MNVINEQTLAESHVIHKTRADFSKRMPQDVVHLVQYDSSLPVLKVDLYLNGSSYTLPSTATVYIRWGKKDHTFVYKEVLGKSQDNKSVYVEVDNQMTYFFGNPAPILELKLGATSAGSSPLNVTIDRNPIQNGDIESHSEYPDLEEAVEKAEQASADAQEAAEKAEDALEQIEVLEDQVDANTNAIAAIKDGTNIDSFSDVESALALKANSVDVYTKTETDNKLALKANSADVYNKTEVDNKDAAVLEESKKYCDNGISDLKWDLPEYDYSSTSDSNVSRIKNIPVNTIQGKVNYIGGKTVKYNQLLNKNNFIATTTVNGVTFTNNGDGSITLNGTATAQISQNVCWTSGYQAGHKYFLKGSPSGGGGSTYTLFIVGQGSTETGNGLIFERSSGANLQIGISNGYTCNNLRFTPEIIDLTDKFGTGNEPTTVSEAVTLLKANGYKLDGTDEYSTAKLKHAAVNAVKYEENLFSTTVESGIFGSDGIKAANTTRVRTANKISLEAGTYTISFSGVNSVAVYIFDTNDVLRNTPGWNDTNQFTFTVDYDFKCNFAWRKTTNVDLTPSNISNIILNKGATVIYPLVLQIPSQVLALELCKSAGNVCDVIDFNTNIGTRKAGNDNPLYNLNWNYSSTYDYFILDSSSVSILKSKLKTPSSNSSVVNLEILGYKAVSWVNMYRNTNAPDKAYCCSSDGYILFKDTSITNHTYNGCKAIIDALTNITYELVNYATYDLTQYFPEGWNDTKLDKLYATVEMVCSDPIDMPNEVSYLIAEDKIEKQNALTAGTGITLSTVTNPNDTISVDTNVIATRDYSESLFATDQEIADMLEEVLNNAR